MNRLSTPDLIEDIQWMLTTGESVEQIPRRLGMTTAAIEKRLRRAGASDLARLFNTSAFRQRNRIAS